MTAKELMIGDWVSYIPEIEEGEDSYLGTPRNVQVDLPCLERIDELIFKPIPLTPEILKKNGFKKVGNYEWQRGINVTRWRLYADDFDSMVEILHAPKYDGFTWKGCDVNYINKLQHALRLCDQTDLADNFKV